MTKLDILKRAFPQWSWSSKENGFVAVGAANGLTLTVREGSFTLNAEKENKVTEIFHGNCTEAEGFPALIDGIKASAAALFSIEMEQKTDPVADLRSQIESQIEIHTYTAEGNRDELPQVTPFVWVAFIDEGSDGISQLSGNAVFGNEKSAIAALVDHVISLPSFHLWKRLYVQQIPVDGYMQSELVQLTSGKYGYRETVNHRMNQL